MLEAESMGIHIITFDISLSISASHVVWSDTYAADREERWREISNDPDLIRAVSERIAIFTGRDEPNQSESVNDSQIDFCI